MTVLLKRLNSSGFFELAKFIAGHVCSYLADGLIIFLLACEFSAEFSLPGISTSILLLAFLLPQFLLSPCTYLLRGGLSRESVLSIASFMKAIIALAISFVPVSGVSSGIICLFAFLMGCASAYCFSARIACVSSMISQRHLQMANLVSSLLATVLLFAGCFVSEFYLINFSHLASIYVAFSLYAIAGLSFLIIKSNSNKEVKETPFNLAGDLKYAFVYLSDHKKAFIILAISIAFAFLASAFANTIHLFGFDFSDIGRLQNFLIASTIVVLAVIFIFAKHITVWNWIAIVFIALCSCISTYNNSIFIHPVFWLIAISIIYGIACSLIDSVIIKMTPDTLKGKLFALYVSLLSFAFISGIVVISYISDKTDICILIEYILVIFAIFAIVFLSYDRRFRMSLVKNVFSKLFFLFYKFHMEGKENIPKRGRMILAGNCSGFLDPLIIQTAAGRNLWFASGASAFTVPLIKNLIQYFNVFPSYDNDESEMRPFIKRKLREGGTAVFLAEKNEETGIYTFGDNLYDSAEDASCIIVPFAIHSGSSVKAGKAIFPAIFSNIVIQFGTPIIFSDNNDREEVLYDLSSRVTFMMESIKRRVSYKNLNRRNVANYRNFLKLVQERGDILGQNTSLMLKNKKFYERYSYGEISRLSKNFANYLIDSVKVKRGEKIAVLTESRPEFAISVISVFESGAIAVPLDAKLTIPEWTSILSDCKPSLLLCSNNFLKQSEELKNRVDSIKDIFIIEKEKPEHTPYKTIFEIKCDLMRDLSRPRLMKETALIVYTSGTTGNPKGVMISFGNIYHQMIDFYEVIDVTSKDTLISVLPLNHLFELTVDCFGMMYLGARVCYVNSVNPKEISVAMKDLGATAMIIVPLFLKVLKSSVEKEIAKKPEYVRKTFAFMYSIAPYCPMFFRRIMFKSVLEAFGGKIRWFIVGGAPLDPVVGDFFVRLGIPVLQGYGLSETSPVVSVNRMGKSKLHTVGHVLPSVKVKISEEGEILISGGSVMQGYYGRPDMTADVIDGDGWFHSGDIGHIDKDGHLVITGRIKNMIVLGGGKKVFPEEVEAVLERSPLIKELCVLSLKIKSGNKAGTEEVGAVIVPSDELLEKSDSEIKKLIENEVKRLSEENLAHYKAPTEIIIHRNELPKTSTRKVKRRELLKEINQ